MNATKEKFTQLINETLPATYQTPVQFNHCFNRIVLDWLYQDCWYHHLNKNKTAIRQLSEMQLQQGIQRMNEWLQDHSILIKDNNASLQYRNKNKAF